MGVTERLARASAARPRRVLAAWGIAVAAALALVATSLSGLTTTADVVGSPQSTKAARALRAAFPREAAQKKADVVIVRSSQHRVDDAVFRSFATRLAGDLAATGVVDVGPRSSVTVSADRHAILLPIVIHSDSAAETIESVVQHAAGDGFSTDVTGFRTANQDFGTLSQSDLEHGELAFGLPAALVVLVLVFGAVVAGLIPVLLAVLSILVGLGIVALLSLEFTLSVFIVNMLSGMGLALGIDYSLFVVSRYREERALGRSEEDAIARAGATASRAVLFSGSTFVVALLGMLIVPTTIMRSLALGAIVVGVVSVVAALTLLPAALGLLGDRVNRLRVPVLGRNLGRADAVEGRFWKRIVVAVLRRPALALALAVVPMLALAAPTLGLHIGANGVSTLPVDTPSRQGYEALQRTFPGREPDPAYVITDTGSQGRRALVRLERRLAGDPRFGPGRVESSSVTSVLTVPVRGDAVGSRAVAAVRDLRTTILPQYFGGPAGPEPAYVGGTTSENIDYFDAATSPTPLVLAFVLGLSIVLLTIAFRSIAVAVVSVLLNLLSVGAAYGLLTLVFIHGIGSGLLGFQHVHVIDAWVPLFLFSVLFGLSMDYQVFLLSRIKERYDHTGSTREGVVSGVSSTARIITGAALIIVVVFAGFARGQLVMFQQMGFGVAVALLLDATVIRSVVLPSLLALLGDRSWYLPRWLGWLPHVEVEAGA